MSARQRRQVASDALSKQRVVVEAVRLADREGVHGLSMRRLAGALGAGAMSLYHYVASNGELMDAMIDVVFDEIELPPEGAFRPPHPRHASVERVEHTGRQNQQDRIVVVQMKIEMPGIINLQDGDKPAQEIPCRHQCGQDWDAWLVFTGHAER